MDSPAVERVSNSVSQLVHRTSVLVYSGCIPVFMRNLRLCRLKSITPVKGWSLSSDPLQLAQELGVGAGLLELGDQEFQFRGGLEGVQDAPDLPDPLGLGRFHEELFLARRGVLDVYGRVEPAVRQLPVEPELHVARSLELLEDDLVHPAAGLDQRGRQDRKRAAVLDIPGCPEELLGRVQSGGVNTAREDAPARGSGEVVGSREPGYAVEQYDHVLALFDEAFDALQDQLRHRYVVVGWLVEGRGDYLGLLHAPLPVGNLLWALVCEHHEELHLRVVGGDGLGYLLQDRRLAGLGRRDDHAALALAYRGHQVYDAGGDVVRLPLQPQALHRVEGGKVVEVRAPAALLGLVVVDGLDAHHRRVLLAVAGWPDLADHVVPAPEVEAFDLARRDVDVAFALTVAVGPQETEPVGQHIEDAALYELLATATPLLPLAGLLPALLGNLGNLAIGGAGEGRVVCGGLGDGGHAGLSVGCRRFGRGPGRHVLPACRLFSGLFGCYLVDHLRELGLAVLAVLLDAQLGGDLVQIAQALALEGAQFGHSLLLLLIRMREYH